MVPIAIEMRTMMMCTHAFRASKCKSTVCGTSVTSREIVVAAELLSYHKKVHQVWLQFSTES